MRLAIIDKVAVRVGQEIGPIFVNNLAKPEIGEKVQLSFADGKAGYGEIVSVAGALIHDWVYTVKVTEVGK